MIVRMIALTSALAIAVLVPTPAQAAPVPAKVVLKETRHADVDGDGRSDTVRIYDTGKKGDNTIWKVKVTTAKGRTSSVTMKLPSYQTTGRLWRGWALLDGNRGAEILLEPETDDFVTFVVLTWRGNALHRELGPGGSPSWDASTEAPGGYRFFTSSGKRYVNTWLADCAVHKGGTCPVKTTRWLWRNNSWHKAAALPTTRVSMDELYARRPLGALKIHA